VDVFDVKENLRSENGEGKFQYQSAGKPSNGLEKHDYFFFFKKYLELYTYFDAS